MQQQDVSAGPDEAVVVLFHASLLGRCDIVQQAISTLRVSCSNSNNADAALSSLISTGRGTDGATPLHLAANSDVIRALLNAGADVNVRCNNGDRPYDAASESSRQAFHVFLFEAIAMGRMEAVEKLLEGGLPVSITDGSDLNDSTLHWAISFSSTPVVSLLLSSGVDVNAANSELCTPLHAAAKAKNSEIARILLDEGANPDAVDAHGNTPLQLASLSEQNSVLVGMLTRPSAPSYSLRAIYQEKQAAAQASAKSPIISELDDASNMLDGVIVDLQEDLPVESGSDEAPLLVLWPPAQRQSRLSKIPLKLDSAQPLLICVASSEIDTFPLLTWSGLMDILDKFSFQAQVKRSSPGCRLRLCIDPQAVPGRHRFDLSITESMASLVASDSTGLLYAVHALVQLIQLHSEVQTGKEGTIVSIPSVALRDWPDVMNRAVLWSHRSYCRTSSSGMREMVELFSKLRINILQLIVDPVLAGESDEASPAASSSAVGAEPTASQMNAAGKIFALYEVCCRFCVELVPTVAFSSLQHNLQIDTLRNFSSKTLNLILLFDARTVAMELVAQLKSKPTSENTGYPPITRVAIEAAARKKCDAVLAMVQLAGFTTVTIAANDWTNRVAQPWKLATQLGLNAHDVHLQTAYPSTCFIKPIVCAQEFICNIAQASARARAMSTGLAVFPAFLDSDFMVPGLLLKYYCFLHAGFSWNAASMADMQLGDLANMLVTPTGSRPDASIIREVVSLTLFSQQATMNLPADSLTALLSVFTGEILSDSDPNPPVASEQLSGISSFGTPIRSSSGSSSNLTASSESAGVADSAIDLVAVEKMIWSLIMSPTSIVDAAVPTKAEAAHCLRFCRRLLNSSKWRVTAPKGLLVDFTFGGAPKDEKHNSMEADELFSATQIMACLCKAIVLSYNGLEKREKEREKEKDPSNRGGASSPIPTSNGRSTGILTFGSLMAALPPGTTSDIANSLLESLEHCTHLWRRRFEGVHFTRKSLDHTESIALAAARASIAVEPSNFLPRQTLFSATSRYMSQGRPPVPCRAIFEALNLPQQSIEETFKRLFKDN